MKVSLVLIFQVVMLLSSGAHASEADFHHTGDYKTLDAPGLIRAQGYDPSAIRELGRRRERSAIGLLKGIAAEPDMTHERKPKKYVTHAEGRKAFLEDNRNISHTIAKIALARMGDQKYFDEFIIGLSSSDYSWQIKCMDYLGEIGDKRAVKFLIPILDERNVPGADPTIPPISMVAYGALGRILPDAMPQYLKESGSKGLYPAQAWKDWWEKNKDTYENSK